MAVPIGKQLKKIYNERYCNKYISGMYRNLNVSIRNKLHRKYLQIKSFNEA